MLHRSNHTVLERTVHSHQNVERPRRYAEEFDTPAPFPELVTSESENKNSAGGREEGKTDEPEQAVTEYPKGPDILQLIVNQEFQEMLERFLVPGHASVIQMRADLRRLQPGGLSAFNRLMLRHKGSLHKLREQLYTMQVQLFRNPHGVSGTWLA